MRTVLIVAGGLLLITLLALVIGSWRWRADTRALLDALRTPRPAPRPAVRHAELDSLPPPVRRYLERALTDGQPWVAGVRLRQEGTFLVSPPSGWQPFTAVQQLRAEPAGFVWAAEIRMAPGVRASIRDAFHAGAGSMRGALFGLVRLVDVAGTPAISRGALQRYLAEAVWCPTALLPRAGVRWTPVSDRAALATIRAGEVEVGVEFRFGADGLVREIYVPDRARTVGDSSVATPWEGRWTRYEARAGMLIPVEGEVAWLLPEGRQPYWRGTVTETVYEPAGP